MNDGTQIPMWVGAVFVLVMTVVSMIAQWVNWAINRRQQIMEIRMRETDALVRAVDRHVSTLMEDIESRWYQIAAIRDGVKEPEETVELVLAPSESK